MQTPLKQFEQWRGTLGLGLSFKVSRTILGSLRVSTWHTHFCIFCAGNDISLHKHIVRVQRLGRRVDVHTTITQSFLHSKYFLQSTFSSFYVTTDTNTLNGYLYYYRAAGLPKSWYSFNGQKPFGYSSPSDLCFPYSITVQQFSSRYFVSKLTCILL